MPNLIDVLLAGLALIIVAFTFTWWQAWRAGRPAHGRPAPLPLLVGFITLFFDTLGIGNYAPTTAIFKLTGMVRDEMIPGTLNVGSSIPVAFEAFAFMVAVAVDPVTIALLVPVGTLGGVVSDIGPLLAPACTWASVCHPFGVHTLQPEGS